jgi:hypothetical protein
MTLQELAADICRNVGVEFPASPSEMRSRQYTHLVEEGAEVVKALFAANLAALRDELADASLSAAMLAHYTDANIETAELAAFPAFNPTYLDIQAVIADVAGPLRRWQGWARRSGTQEEFVVALGLVMCTVRQLAINYGIDLMAAVEDKAKIIYSRGWREPAVPQ